MAPRITAGRRRGLLDHAAFPSRRRAARARIAAADRARRSSRRETERARRPRAQRPALGATSDWPRADDLGDAVHHGLTGFDLGREIGGVALGGTQALVQRAVAVTQRQLQAGDGALGGVGGGDQCADRSGASRAFVGLEALDPAWTGTSR